MNYRIGRSPCLQMAGQIRWDWSDTLRTVAVLFLVAICQSGVAAPVDGLPVELRPYQVQLRIAFDGGCVNGLLRGVQSVCPLTV